MASQTVAYIEAAATALPAYGYSQEEIAQAVGSFFTNADGDSIAKIFKNTRVRRRYFAQPLAFYRQPQGFAQKNNDAVEKTCALGMAALDSLCQEAGLSLQDINQLVVVNSTCLATPTLDALLLHKTDLPKTCQRTPLFGLGCVGGAAGLARAAALVGHRAQGVCALLAVELCGHTFNQSDQSSKNLIATALFGDGAASVLLRSQRTFQAKAKIVATGSMTFPDSIGVMGWHFSELGLGLVLSRELPDIVRRYLKDACIDFLRSAGIDPQAIRHYLAHPGGPKVIEAIQETLELEPEKFELTWRHLEACGNLSSASVLFVLQEALKSKLLGQGELALLFALGPGFSAEFVLLEGL